MRGFNPDHLKALAEVVEQGSFTAAARHLSLSQPAVSIQIRDLEERCGLTLLERGGRRPTLTAAGQDLLVHAKRIAQENDLALATMRRHKNGALGRVRVGMSTTTLIYVAGNAIRQLRREHPTLQISVSVGTSPELSGLVRDNDLDLAVVTLPIDMAQLASAVMLDDEMVAILPADWPGIPAQVTPAYIAEQPLVLEHRAAVLRGMVLDWLPSGGANLDQVFELSHLEAIKGAVAAGIGASIVPQVLVQDAQRLAGIAVRPLKPKLFRKLAIVQRRDKAMTDAIAVVRKTLLQCRLGP